MLSINVEDREWYPNEIKHNSNMILMLGSVVF